MHWLDYVNNIDDSHPMTTANKHIKMICDLIYDRTVVMVEFGSYYGYSTAAFALSSPSSQIISVDLSDHISEQTRINTWHSLGIHNIVPYTMSTSQFLLQNKNSYDVIFHDAVHGPKAIPEYIECVNRTDCLVIHDFEQISDEARQSIKKNFKNTVEDYDHKGRCLFIGQK